MKAQSHKAGVGSSNRRRTNTGTHTALRHQSSQERSRPTRSLSSKTTGLAFRARRVTRSLHRVDRPPSTLPDRPRLRSLSSGPFRTQLWRTGRRYCHSVAVHKRLTACNGPVRSAQLRQSQRPTLLNRRCGLSARRWTFFTARSAPYRSAASALPPSTYA